MIAIFTNHNNNDSNNNNNKKGHIDNDTRNNYNITCYGATTYVKVIVSVNITDERGMKVLQPCQKILTIIQLQNRQ